MRQDIEGEFRGTDKHGTRHWGTEYDAECFAGSTLVRTIVDGKIVETRIEDIKEDDIVLSWVNAGEETVGYRVKSVYTSEKPKPIMEVFHEHGGDKPLLVTGFHRVMTEKGPKWVKNLKVGDVLVVRVNDKDVPSKVTAPVRTAKTMERVYNLQLEGTGNRYLIADGVVAEHWRRGLERLSGLFDRTQPSSLTPR